MTGFVTLGYFLFSLIFESLTFLLWARIAIRYHHISSLHPFSQVINALMNPLLSPINHFFKIENKASNRYDWPAFGALVSLELLKFVLLGLFFFDGILSPQLLLLYTAAELILQPCSLLFYAMIIYIIISWINPGWRHPLADIIRIITAPLLNFGKRVIPPLAGFDLSPFLIIILLRMITLFIRTSLQAPLI